jgi:hypothetical protein
MTVRFARDLMAQELGLGSHCTRLWMRFACEKAAFNVGSLLPSAR